MQSPRGVRPVRVLAPALCALLAAALLACASPQAATDTEECTIVLLSGRVTPDGRPVLSKNRDAPNLDNEVRYFADGRLRYVALVNAGDDTRAWAGLNERGFAVLNALSFNIRNSLDGTVPLGVLMKWALQNCDSIADFRRLLDDTNWSGRTSPANYAVLDATGAVSLFEAGNRSYVEYRVDDPAETPAGYLVRTNFSFSADTLGSSRTRYHRCDELVRAAAGAGDLDVPFLLSTVARDLWCRQVNPYPLPYEGTPLGYPSAVGFVDASDAINARATVASCTVLGVKPGENPLLATFFTTLGQPVVSPPFPVWVAAGPTPPELDGPATSPVCDIARTRAAGIYSGTLLDTRKLVDGTPTGHLTRVEWITQWMLAETAAVLEGWRSTGPDSSEMAAAEYRIASDGYGALLSAPGRGPLQVRLLIGPNPARGSVHISYEFEEPPPEDWFLEVYDVRGRRAAKLSPDDASRLLTGALVWDGRIPSGRAPAGVYYCRIAGTRASRAERVVLVR
jgi:hypothetical protein